MPQGEREKPLYQVIWTERAEKMLRKIDRATQPRITDAAEGLSTEPRPTNPKHGHKMQGKYLEIWTRYVGLNYRILYALDDAAQMVTITEVGPREGIYKRGR